MAKVLTDQRRHAVQFGVERAFSFPRIHFSRLQTKDVLLEWEETCRVHVNGPAVYIRRSNIDCYRRAVPVFSPSATLST